MRGESHHAPCVVVGVKKQCCIFNYPNIGPFIIYEGDERSCRFAPQQLRKSNGVESVGSLGC